ncbi:SulP family inorganic anion transporter [Methyloceanibacter superfactus]|uniref:SulP family inorganic anion transporter n=1 Tax=Methyloceanibacter superfactus TaxID=1774969 RepID=UPI000ABC381B|nr:SulP family inorganic anion transporter [Methyloceanibacter superfactus]
MRSKPRHGPSFAELYTPKLFTVLREGYGLGDFRADAIAGLTVAIVALPLSMAIAIASGVGPERGLFTAIVGGFLVSALGGSRFQIGGPAGAFIVIIAAIVERHGYDGLVLATLVAGLILIAAGFFRLGTYIKYIPFPVTVGFTAGIAVIIFASQLKELLGLDLTSEPAAFVPKLEALWAARATVNAQALAIGAVALAIIVGLRRWRPTWPGFLLAVIAAGGLAWALNLDVATISSRSARWPRSLPDPSLPPFSLAKLQAVLPDAVTIALLGAIESLLSAVVADGMSGRRHRSNCELVAQGVANVGATVFGGIPVTGTIARTATNVRAGAKGPVSGILHAGYLLLFMLVAAPLAGYIPLAALGAVLAVVAWNMAERDDFIALLRASGGDRIILLATFLLTVFVDLTTGIGVGVVLGAFIFLHRMAESVEVAGEAPLIAEDQADDYAGRTAYDPAEAAGRDVVVYRISGAFFFGAVAAVSGVLERIGERPRVLVLDFSEVPMVDSTAAKTLLRFAEKLAKAGAMVYLAGATPAVRRELLQVGLKKPLVRYAKSVEQAISHATPGPDQG